MGGYSLDLGPYVSHRLKSPEHEFTCQNSKHTLKKQDSAANNISFLIKFYFPNKCAY
jgi:hypothetical protein